MSILEGVLIFTAGLVIGGKIVGYFSKLGLKTILENLNVSEEELQEALRKSGADFLIEDEEGNDITEAVPIRVEKVDDQLLAYRVLDNTFIAQGDTAKQLLERIGDRFGSQQFRIDDERGGKYLEGHI